MKKTVTFLLLISALGLNAQQGPQAFTQAASEAQARLEKALDDLDQIQSEVATKRPELGATLDQVETQALRLRDEASNAERLTASFGVEVSQLNNAKQSVIDNNNYIKSALLNEYLRRLQLTIDPSEIPQYDENIREALAFMETEEEIDDATIFTQQLKLVQASLKRVESIIGGKTFDGPAIVDGKLKEGTFAMVGPVSYFSDGAGLVGITKGMRENRANIYVLKGYEESIDRTAATGNGTLPFDTTDGEALEGITHNISLTEEWALGGFVMYPILGLFALAILIALYKTIELFRVKAAKGKDIEVILDQLRGGNADTALAHAKSVGGPVGVMLCAAVENAQEDREVIEEVLYETIIKTQPKLERFLAFIAVVAATAPLLGLLGTVTGMIKTFKLITIVGTGDARNLSSGISEALITTKWGLIVAIPTLIMHALLNRKAKGVVGSMEQAAVSFINGIVEMRDNSTEG